MLKPELRARAKEVFETWIQESRHDEPSLEEAFDACFDWLWPMYYELWCRDVNQTLRLIQIEEAIHNLKTMSGKS